MKVIINHEEIAISEDCDPLEALAEVLQYIKSHNLVIVQQKIDGEVFDGDLHETVNNSAVTLLELEVIAADNLLQEMMYTAVEFLPRFRESIMEIVVLLQEGKDGEAVRLFISSLEGFEWIQALIGGMQQFRANDISKFTGNIHNYNEALTQLLAAWENRDLVLISDVLEYEVVPLVDGFWHDIRSLLPAQ